MQHVQIISASGWIEDAVKHDATIKIRDAMHVNSHLRLVSLIQSTSCSAVYEPGAGLTVFYWFCATLTFEEDAN